MPFAGTAGLSFNEMTQQRVEITVANSHKVQNQSGSVHASAINLLAETATAMVMGMNVRDDCKPQIKEFKMVFQKNAEGALRAVATLTPEQRALMQASTSGEVNVAVTVTDESGDEPVVCDFVWTWLATNRTPSRSAVAKPHQQP